ADRKVIGSLRAGDVKLRGIDWLDEDRLLVRTSVTGVPLGLVGEPDEWGMLQVWDLAHNKVQPLMNGITGNTTMNVAFGRAMLRRVGGRTVLFVCGYYVTKITLPALYRID